MADESTPPPDNLYAMEQGRLNDFAQGLANFHNGIQLPNDLTTAADGFHVNTNPEFANNPMFQKFLGEAAYNTQRWVAGLKNTFGYRSAMVTAAAPTVVQQDYDASQHIRQLTPSEVTDMMTRANETAKTTPPPAATPPADPVVRRS